MLLVANYFFAALIGAAAGAIELLRRYRDAPWVTLREGAAIAYVLINAASSLIAYHLVLVFDVRFGVTNPAFVPAVQVLVAGLAAVTFFRTTFFTAKVGETVLEIGPSAILQVLLSVTDRTIDRGRAIPRATDVPRIMGEVDFAKAAEALPAFCFGVMQNITSEEQAAAREQIGIIARTTLSNRLKSNLLGLLLVNLVGMNVLTNAVKALDGEIR